VKWFTADQHLDHPNILEYEMRPFKKLQDMNNEIIRRHNTVVAPEDTVYFIGDISLRGPENFNYYRALLRKLNGEKHLILGNHDRLNPFAYVEAGFISVHTSLIIRDWDGNEYVLCHDPAPACIDHNLRPDSARIWLCGHVHSLFATCRNVINVGVDVRNFTPISFNEVYEIGKTLKLAMWETWKGEGHA